MKKTMFACAMSALLLLAVTGWADDTEKDQDRLQTSGTVLHEILNVPDDIPQDLLDKADCVVVFPSVLKAAFVVGASYGRGAMTCRRGENFNGPRRQRNFEQQSKVGWRCVGGGWTGGPGRVGGNGCFAAR